MAVIQGYRKMTEINFADYTQKNDVLLESTAEVLAGRKTLAQAARLPSHILEKTFKMASTAFMAEDYKKSEELFSLLFSLDNKDRNAQIGYAGSLEAQSKFKDALNIYLMQIVTTPFDPVAPFRAGICFLELQDKKQAIQAFKMASACKKKMAKDSKKLTYAQKADTMLKMLKE